MIPLCCLLFCLCGCDSLHSPTSLPRRTNVQSAVSHHIFLCVYIPHPQVIFSSCYAESSTLISFHFQYLFVFHPFLEASQSFFFLLIQVSFGSTICLLLASIISSSSSCSSSSSIPSPFIYRCYTKCGQIVEGVYASDLTSPGLCKLPI